MADDFSFTDSEDERAVQDLLSQAMDHSLLEQIAKINCSSFSTDDLPSDLETRFRKLKSLPTVTAAGSRFPPEKSKSFTPRSADRNLDLKISPPDIEYSGRNRSKPVEHKNLPENVGGDGNGRLPPSKKSPEDSPSYSEYSDGNRDSKSKPKSMSLKSRSGSSNWNLSSPESRSVSPVRRSIGCLWCSPKKEKRKEGKENRSVSSSSFGNDYDAEFLKTSSTKERNKIMRKAMKEEEKIAKEVDKIVKWAKQASDRMMDVSGVVDDLLFSDVEDTN